MVSRDLFRVVLAIEAINDLDVLSYDIHNAYLTSDCREWVWVVARNEFGYDSGKDMLVRKALYGLKISGAAIRAFL